MNKIAMMVVFAAFAFAIPASADQAGGGAVTPDWMEWNNAPNVQLASCSHCEEEDDGYPQHCMDTCKNMNRASVDAGQVTRYASSLKSPAANEGICDTDPYSCFYLAGDQTRKPALTSDVQVGSICKYARGRC